MKKIVIEGQKQLSGTISISGAKNSAVALIPAAILCDEETNIDNIPDISDKNNLIKILNLLNVEVCEQKETLTINPKKIKNTEIPKELSSKLRASYYFMGALLGKEKKVCISFPGGCDFGVRKIDLHLKGFESLGATIKECNGEYIITADELKGTNIYLDFASVGATINIMLAAVKAKGITQINNAAKEPEIVNVATFLNNMGAKISGAGTSKIKIEGVDYLHRATVEVIPDRIEAGTYLILGALLGKELIVKNVIPEHLNALLSKMSEMGVKLEQKGNEIRVNCSDNYKAIHITTLTYPGFPTDLAQPMSVLLTKCNGMSSIDETIYAKRLGHIPYLKQMGASIEIEGSTAYIKGPSNLKGSNVQASDLRAGASLVLAGLIANGTTTITNIEYILRGYSHIIEKLSEIGAQIKIIEEENK